MEAFGRYRKKESSTKVLLIYLLLGGYDISKLRGVRYEEENLAFGTKVRKLYGFTEDYVNVGELVHELEVIETPIICSQQTFEYYSDSRIVYSYSAPAGTEFWLNDMGVISKHMIISEEGIISCNMAKSTMELEDEDKGFMFFLHYIMHDEVRIGKWQLSYINGNFTITYFSDGGDPLEVYNAIESEKTATYKWAIYVIRKAAPYLQSWKPDNFDMIPLIKDNQA